MHCVPSHISDKFLFEKTAFSTNQTHGLQCSINFDRKLQTWDCFTSSRPSISSPWGPNFSQPSKVSNASANTSTSSWPGEDASKKAISKGNWAVERAGYAFIRPFCVAVWPLTRFWANSVGGVCDFELHMVGTSPPSPLVRIPWGQRRSYASELTWWLFLLRYRRHFCVHVLMAPWTVVAL